MCYNGWTKYKTSCYKRVGQAKNYAAASADCTGQSAALLKIDDQDELDFLVSEWFSIYKHAGIKIY